MRLAKLYESMIDVPHKLIETVNEFLYAYIISFLTEIGYDENEALGIMDYIDHNPQYTKLYKSFNFDHPKNVVFETEIDTSRYDFKYNMETNKLHIRFISDGKYNYGGFDTKTNTLLINIEHLKILMANKDMKKEFLKYLIEEYMNTIEHELQHYIQVNSFGKKDPKQLQTGPNFDGSMETAIKNVTSAAEFLPTIKSEYNTFKNRIRALQRNAKLNRNDKIQLLRYFIGDSSARIQRFSDIIEDFESNVFYKMKEMNKDLWKKAVKIIINEIKKDEEFLNDENN
ncbi:hypothetical protein PBI_SCTP2_250 [Salicola phage SCTP-2]|nr:hypothetical protein PBI_SCTP2_250 [Salicola phage SCTP-2]